MSDDPRLDAVRRHWDRADLADRILAALPALGGEPVRLTVEDLAPLDQFHAGGLAFTRRLAALGGLAPGDHVLDVGGGLGGPARTLAAEVGCRVTVVDLAPSYVEAGRRLTELVGLQDRVTFVVGDALALPFGTASFDVVWTQNSGMNIADKARLYATFRRVLAPGGRLVTQEPMAGPGGRAAYPHMWADDPSTDHLQTPGAMRSIIEAAGFAARHWEEVTPVRPAPGAPRPSATIQELVMGRERLEAIMAAAQENQRERRIVMVHAVFTATGAPSWVRPAATEGHTRPRDPVER